MGLFTDHREALPRQHCSYLGGAYPPTPPGGLQQGPKQKQPLGHHRPRVRLCSKVRRAFHHAHAHRRLPPPSQDAINQTRKLQAVKKIRIKNCALYNTGVRAGSDFILAIVDDIWVHELRDPTPFYTNVLPSTLLQNV